MVWSGFHQDETLVWHHQVIDRLYRKVDGSPFMFVVLIISPFIFVVLFIIAWCKHMSLTNSGLARVPRRRRSRTAPPGHRSVTPSGCESVYVRSTDRQSVYARGNNHLAVYVRGTDHQSIYFDGTTL